MFFRVERRHSEVIAARNIYVLAMFMDLIRGQLAGG
jgi:hypothetical protein